MSKVSRSYQNELLKALRDPVEAAAYLNAALEERSYELFLLAVRNVVKARGIKKLPEEGRLNQELILSENGNPQLSSLSVILDNIGLRFAVEVKETVSAASA